MQDVGWGVEPRWQTRMDPASAWQRPSTSARMPHPGPTPVAPRRLDPASAWQRPSTGARMPHPCPTPVGPRCPDPASAWPRQGPRVRMPPPCAAPARMPRAPPASPEPSARFAEGSTTGTTSGVKLPHSEAPLGKTAPTMDKAPQVVTAASTVVEARQDMAVPRGSKSGRRHT